MQPAGPVPEAPKALQTARLLLRDWRDDDLAPFAALNADPYVMRWFPKLLDQGESDAIAARIRAGLAQRGFGFWAVDLPGTGFIGFVGLSVPRFEAHFTPCVEVGWRLARAHWGQGYATEAGMAALSYGFEVAGLTEIVALAVAGNAASRAVMTRLAMRHHPADDFDHPDVPPGDPKRRFVLYRINAAEWAGRRA